MAARLARLARLARRAFAHAAYFAALGVLLLGVVRGGATYFHCALMNAYLVAPCCDVGHGHDGDDGDAAVGAASTSPDGVAVGEAPCCAAARLTHLPVSTPSAEAKSVAAPLVAELPPPSDLVAHDACSVHALSAVQFARDGPPPARARRARLMVYVI